MHRISIRGKRFREIVDNEELRVSKSDSINVVVVNAAPLSRTYYVGTYDPDKPMAPFCWSEDTYVPAQGVPEDQRQSARCIDCTNNIRGAGLGGGRACRFQQRLAVVEERNLSTFYQLQVPANSIFGGEINNTCMSLQTYAKFLSKNNTPSIAVVTKISFDVDDPYPKLCFHPSRPLEDDELEEVGCMVNHDDTLKAISIPSETLFTKTQGFDINSQQGDQNG